MDSRDGYYDKFISTWFLYFIFILIIICIVSYGLAPSSLLAPMGSLTLVFNTFLAWKVLHEHINKLDILATFIIVAGAVVSIIFGDQSPSDVYIYLSIYYFF